MRPSKAQWAVGLGTRHGAPPATERAGSVAFARGGPTGMWAAGLVLGRAGWAVTAAAGLERAGPCRFRFQ